MIHRTHAFDLTADSEVLSSREQEPLNRRDELLLQHHGGMSLLTCPLCGEEQDPAGPGVSSHRDGQSPCDLWVSCWTPFIEDLRGTPERLVHPRCFADANGFDALIAVITAYDQRGRLEEPRRFLRDA